MRRIKCLLELEILWCLIFAMTRNKTFPGVNSTFGFENTVSGIKEAMRSN